mgnify:CR=1 FL=1
MLRPVVIGMEFSPVWAICPSVSVGSGVSSESAPSFTSFDLMGYTNLPDTHIETKLGEIKELMPPERFMSQYKFSMADVDIEVSSQNKQKAVELLNKKGFFLFLVKKELQGGEVQIALHPCKMIDVPKKYRKYITGKTKIIPLSKEDLS